MPHHEKEILKEKRLVVNNLSLHSLVAKNAFDNSVPIVLVCGLGISSRYMIPAALELSKNFNVYCPDLPGFGKSSKPAHTLNISELAESLNGFLHQSRIERAVIVGHSLGCQIAAEFALRYPKKLESLVLAAPSGDPNINSALRYFGRLMLDSLFEPFSLIPLAVRDYLRAGIFRGIQTFQFALRDRFEDKLHHIKTSTLVVRGSRDPIVSNDWVKRMTHLLPKAELKTIEGAAHAVNYNSPKQFAKVITEFVYR